VPNNFITLFKYIPGAFLVWRLEDYLGFDKFETKACGKE